MTEVAAHEEFAADAACERYVPSTNIPGACEGCWWTHGAHSYKAGGPSGVGQMPEGDPECHGRICRGDPCPPQPDLS